MPKNIDARRYLRAALRRLDDAILILHQLDRPAAATYLAGYSVECALKAMMLDRTSKQKQSDMALKLKKHYRHNLITLSEDVRRKGQPPLSISQKLSLVCESEWSPEQRYDPGPGDRKDAEVFLDAVTLVVQWVERSL